MTARTNVDSRYLDDRETQVTLYVERIGMIGGEIVFTFEGGLYGSHSITELAETPAAWDRARAHWKGYIDASNDKLATVATVVAPAPVAAPKVKRAPVKRAAIEHTLKRYRYRLVSRRSDARDNAQVHEVEARTKTEARKYIAEAYRLEIPPARYGFVPFSAHRIEWVSVEDR